MVTTRTDVSHPENNLSRVFEFLYPNTLFPSSTVIVRILRRTVPDTVHRIHDQTPWSLTLRRRRLARFKPQVALACKLDTGGISSATEETRNDGWPRSSYPVVCGRDGYRLPKGALSPSQVATWPKSLSRWRR